MAYQFPIAPGCCSAIRSACTLHRRFFGCAPEHLLRTQIEKLEPRVLVELGELRALVYRAARDGRQRNYVHHFEQPPRLLADAQGRRLFIAGGRYRVTRQGIEG